MQLPSKEKEIVIRNNTYKATIPNNRGFMNLFARKAQLSKEQYDVMKFSLDGNAGYAALLVDTIATFEAIMPEQFFKDINFKNILEADLIAGAEMVKIYQDQVSGWFNEWLDAIASVLNPKAEQKDAE